MASKKNIGKAITYTEKALDAVIKIEDPSRLLEEAEDMLCDALDDLNAWRRFCDKKRKDYIIKEKDALLYLFLSFDIFSTMMIDFDGEVPEYNAACNAIDKALDALL